MVKKTSKTTREKRSEILIANFQDGFADNWFMAVGTCFRNELDIKKTKRIKTGKQHEIWTQGSAYNFKEGQILYDTPAGYSPWGNALKEITLICKIVKSKPKTMQSSNKIQSDGIVNFVLYKINSDKTGIVETDNIELSQSNFVVFLKTGEIHGEQNKHNRNQGI